MIRTLIALCLLSSCMLATPAHAATAFLLHCENSISPIGNLVWVGTYQYGSTKFTRVFPVETYCPATVEIF